MQLSFITFCFVTVAFARINMNHHVLQHVLAPVTTRYSTVNLHSTSQITVTAQPASHIYQNSTPTVSAASAPENASSGSEALRACYPTIANGQPDWSAPCRTRQKLIFECQFTGRSTLSDDAWTNIMQAAQEPPSLSNTTQQHCLCVSSDFWEATQKYVTSCKS